MLLSKAIIDTQRGPQYELHMGSCRYSALPRHQPEFASHRNPAHLPLTSSGRHVVPRSIRVRLALVGPHAVLPAAVDFRAAQSPSDISSVSIGANTSGQSQIGKGTQA
ncbi:hypothetical protein CSUB01_02695 [Colletotrichum sublineola]|uniref:Uncharacterized protein n=1 Tax=Colletotrichum sublineola TaxID=1173701 RepID=A0A066XAK7_COLSU|nr:hypothetical protein CSUB01_02695 [Colletotrichum sublineola]